jgi:uncharacterized ferritin-like protein (DUF455 family)
MKITEFAEQIVFGKSLDEKLMPPGKLSYDRGTSKSSSVLNLPSPGRPAELLMQHDPGRTLPPPADHQLENEKARGQLLHFLANHELLATELMALVLLKFPDAPRAFRQGVLVTLQEEQEHTRMYLRRMKECGVEFGSYPVGGQFWRIVEPMRSPMDFVSRLSLTFEQANLDYSLHFASVFRSIGDTETAALLQKIYEDEIGHVQHGLEWFRQWKDPAQSDWQAYERSLEFPMSPERGRGGPKSAFNRLGRQKAGLDEGFINAIEVYGKSRDRAATVRWFDSGAEAEFNDATPQKASPLDGLSRDLEYLMLLMGKRDDLLLVRELPSTELKKQWIDAGFDLPEFVLLDEIDSLSGRKLHAASPWAWTPANHKVAEPLLNQLRVKPAAWSEFASPLFRKSFGVGLVKRWQADVDRNEFPDWLAGAECNGVCVSSESQLREALKAIRDRGFKTAVFKPDLSASGRGQYRIDTSESEPVSRGLRSGSTAVVEPWLDRVLDLSFLWRIAPGEASAKFLGWARSEIAAGNRYKGTMIGNPFGDCSSEVRRFLLTNRYERLNFVAKWLEKRIVPELLNRGFQGYFGIDSMVYRDMAGQLKLRPFVELNPRTTMGHVALSLRSRIAQNVCAQLRLFSRAEYLQCREELESLPVELSSNGKLCSGAVSVSEFSNSSKLVPCILVGSAFSRLELSRS